MGLLIVVLAFAACWLLARLLRKLLPNWASRTLGYLVFIVVSGGGAIWAAYWVWFTMGYLTWAPLTLLYATIGLAACFAGNTLRSTLQR